MLSIEMLKAGWGDCLWIEYGDESRTYKILIDGGITSTYRRLADRILKLPEEERHFELFIITHIDGDHIEGAIKLLGNMNSLGVTFGDIWFNGYEHLTVDDGDKLGGAYGEFLSALIKKKNLNWNEAFGKGTIFVPDEGKIPEKELRGGLKLKVLSPTRVNLENLIIVWRDDIEKAGLSPTSSLEEVLDVLESRSALRPGDDLDDKLGEHEINIEVLADSWFDEDRAEANGSSITVLMEYDGKKCLLTGDAFPSVIYSSIERLLSDQGRLELDLFKVAHHGSQNNTDNNLLRLIRCQNYFLSSNGKRYGHPDPETIGRILVNSNKKSVNLYFNERSKINKIWDDPELKNGDYPYITYYALDDDDGIRIKFE